MTPALHKQGVVGTYTKVPTYFISRYSNSLHTPHW